MSPKHEMLALCRITSANLRTAWFRLAHSDAAEDRRGMGPLFLDTALLLEAGLSRQPKRGPQRIAPHCQAAIQMVAQMLRELGEARRPGSVVGMSDREDSYLRSAFRVLGLALEQEEARAAARG